MVTWGEQTNDEMCLGVYDFVALDAPRPPEIKPANAVGGQ